ncbi:uncharacterized protein si:dkeyp-97a10.2 [Colossoma macropomum]|uniref:uncharacterized protein si:dkeyp-97a10.2 n=1 Tax=Colossoma macropomum TaxID=42526 RepID=UPI0018654686|nr:uncharacterized protein si:dkeyp-97a10.2 [Colossoma macropomum]XP_036413859.1 uncharacterized protein si:dkeyp-97a10.2 [Colossoma macropomum]XP_036413860.1 uncharacterized protein si:dkeyp-97a10.2 [Colossoma macropomum]
MGLGPQSRWAVLLFQVFVLQGCQCVSVRFPSQQPIYVVSGENLILQAQIDQSPGEFISKVTWEHEAEATKNSGKTTVAEFPFKSSGGRVTVEKDGAVMKLSNYQRTDSGVYTITVTNQHGGQASARCNVHEYEAVHHVSVMVNVSHSVLHCREAWGTDPVFSWLHEKAAVTEAVGKVSTDGSSLQLSIPLCGHFTCVVSNKLGHSSATYTGVPCERSNGGTAVAIVSLLFVLLLAGGLTFLLWRRHRHYSSRRERLQESFEDTV